MARPPGPEAMEPEVPSDMNTHTDPETLIAPGPGERTQGGREEWALIRYVGAPIGEVIHLQGPELWIGRSSDNAICLPEAEVSRRHARVSLIPQPDGGNSVQIEDQGSTNGTYLNGKRVRPEAGPVTLRNGDVLRVSHHAFKLKRLDELERHYHETVLAQTTVDPLTGVSNRATVLGYLEKHFELARRYKRPLSVVLCDLDRFKAINDTHGHAAGDQVLQRFGAVLLGRLRGSDQAGRIGGEEFLLVLPETQSQDALNVAEDIRKSVFAEELPTSSGPLRCTCSLGVAQIQDGDSNGGALLARADVALYRAKGLGRNRVEYDARR
ncbi:MAG: GGDEF domain-containing protein [Acidobacteria bacterium]|nr:GGDEF domain-containing protein [Acidobacteriota bacterium]